MTRDEREAMGLQRGTYFGVAPELPPAEWMEAQGVGLVPPDCLLRVLDVMAKEKGDDSRNRAR